MEIAYIACGGFVIAAFITDIRSMRIPNILTMSSILSGLIVHLILGGIAGFNTAAIGLGVGFGLMIILYLLGAVGAGDVKIFGGIGAWTGALFTMQVMLYSILISGAIGLLILIYRRRAAVFRMRMRRSHSVLMFVQRLTRAVSVGKTGNEGVISVNSTETSVRFPFMLAVLPGVIIGYVQNFHY
ncbi:prepilin peptidase [Paenibacillus sp. 453mf]|uniref:A24 family peptidase n=1 Tax=Paenibacillus sp. 453mf TaxID=1761874 RepID=UPI0008EBBFE2|nr:prepilin peptidase [Paenibacillus sp. 453mf]SFS40004.1 prepilin peptidase CpaA [Paenibacillus sp. 453mf]